MTTPPTNTLIEVVFQDRPDETWLVNLLPNGGVAVSPPTPDADFSAVLEFVSQLQQHIK